MKNTIVALFILAFSIHMPTAWGEENLPSDTLLEAKKLNESGQIIEAWKVLAEAKDTYAKIAVKIFSPSTTLEGCVVKAQWDNVVGSQVREAKFQEYGQRFQQKYLNFLAETNEWPSTFNIENFYASTIEEMGFPQSLSVDLAMNQVPKNSRKKLTMDVLSSLINFGGRHIQKDWYDFVEITSQRVSDHKLKADMQPKDADKLIWKTMRKSVKCYIKLDPDKQLPPEDL